MPLDFLLGRWNKNKNEEPWGKRFYVFYVFYSKNRN